MYGIPEGLDLTFLHGRELVQVCLGLHQVQFHFRPDATLAVEGAWELFDAAGHELDRNEPRSRSKPFQFHRVLGRSVVASEIRSPHWFTLYFDSGESLRVFDNSAEYESFSIQPGDIVV